MRLPTTAPSPRALERTRDSVARPGLLRRGRTLVAVVVLAAASLGAATAAGAAVPAHDAARAPGLPATTSAAPIVPTVLVIGTSGVQWEDVSAQGTPALWELAGRGAVGSTVVRSVRPATCPADGWLALSAGTRAGDVEHEPDADGDVCRALAEPQPAPGSDASTGADGWAVPAWAEYTAAAQDESFGAVPGTLGDALASAGTPAAAFGPGAAIALARTDGTLPAWAPATDDDAFTAALGDALVAGGAVVVDAGTVRGATASARADGVARVDAVVARVLAALADEDGPARAPLVLLTSLADAWDAPRLQVAAVSYDDPAGPVGVSGAFRGTLGSPSTRQPGYTLGYDVTRTVVSHLGLDDHVPASTLDGAVLRSDGAAASLDERAGQLRDDARKSVVVRQAVAPYYVLFVVANLLLQVVVSIGIARLPRAAGALAAQDVRSAGMSGAGAAGAAGPEETTVRGAHPEARRDARRAVPRTADGLPLRWLRGLRVAALTIAALPVATYLANLVPWWRGEHPAVALVGTLTVAVAAIVAACLVPAVRRRPLGAMTLLAALTTLVLAADVATGARLQLTSLMGTQPLVAGRFYGFNNTAFALFATSTVLLATGLAHPLVARGRRRLAAAVVAVVGLVAVALDGLPSVGADFGGPPALVPAFAVLVLLVLGVRLTWRRVVAVLGAGALTVALFAVADWLRPADARTHLGAFVQTVLDGGAGAVIARKAGQNLSNLVGSSFTFIAIGAVVVVVLGIRRAGGRLGAPLVQVARALPVLRAGLVAFAVVQTIAFLLNDSGIVIPAIGLALALPLLVATYAGLDPTLRAAGLEAERTPR